MGPLLSTSSFSVEPVQGNAYYQTTFQKLSNLHYHCTAIAIEPLQTTSRFFGVTMSSNMMDTERGGEGDQSVTLTLHGILS